MSTPAPITALRAVRDLLIDQPDASLWPVAAAIDTWLAAGDGDFAAALGLPPGWHSALRRRQRNDVLCEVARRRFPALNPSAAALALLRASRRYEGTSWPRDRKSGRRPDGINGDIFDVLSLGEMPCERILRSLFSELDWQDAPVSVAK